MHLGGHARLHRREVDPVGGRVDEHRGALERAGERFDVGCVDGARASPCRRRGSRPRLTPAPRRGRAAPCSRPLRTRRGRGRSPARSSRRRPSTATWTAPSRLAFHQGITVAFAAGAAVPSRKGWDGERSDQPRGTGRRRRHHASRAQGTEAGALGYISNLVIAVASTAPAYSLAATLGFIVAVTGVGVHAPAVLIVSFIPILFVSVGYRFFNLADPDAGTSFAWVTRAFGPAARLDQRLGDLPRRHHRDGIAGGDREQIHLLAVERASVERRPDRRRSDLDRR